MLKAWKATTTKQQIYAAICFVIAYFSPLIGMLLFLFMKIRRIDPLLRIAIIFGAVAALTMYSIDAILYFI